MSEEAGGQKGSNAWCERSGPHWALAPFRLGHSFRKKRGEVGPPEWGLFL